MSSPCLTYDAGPTRDLAGEATLCNVWFQALRRGSNPELDTVNTVSVIETLIGEQLF